MSQRCRRSRPSPSNCHFSKFFCGLRSLQTGACFASGTLVRLVRLHFYKHAANIHLNIALQHEGAPPAWPPVHSVQNCFQFSVLPS
ncbi:hypothetical protein PHAMO_280193 [Magnetospirillum molischianum DSM 120]|uniref:Uncharacterized protein n=1 Tax=Magnetospirillum molischianum DSM 120 TaxID=1150626 RepID=H8FTH1_MAGML|nr:hypothetical protein PHAMO_280193 [Magnetospirillum molischianum DSM 120]